MVIDKKLNDSRTMTLNNMQLLRLERGDTVVYNINIFMLTIELIFSILFVKIDRYSNIYKIIHFLNLFFWTDKQNEILN